VVAAVATNYETAKWQKRVVYDPNGMVVDELSWMGMSYSLQMYNEWRRDTTMVGFFLSDGGASSSAFSR